MGVAPNDRRTLTWTSSDGGQLKGTGDGGREAGCRRAGEALPRPGRPPIGDLTGDVIRPFYCLR